MRPITIRTTTTIATIIPASAPDDKPLLPLLLDSAGWVWLGVAELPVEGVDGKEDAEDIGTTATTGNAVGVNEVTIVLFGSDIEATHAASE